MFITCMILPCIFPNILLNSLICSYLIVILSFFNFVSLLIDLICFFFRPVTPADVQSIEKRLLQTMDMIIIKKKRIALAKRGSTSRGAFGQGIWGMLKNVATNSNSSESILF